jgi:hypothetical protein
MEASPNRILFRNNNIHALYVAIGIKNQLVAIAAIGSSVNSICGD